MEAIEVFRAHLLRSDVNQSWGFQLQGGSEVHQPLKISNVAVGSAAEATGLRVEDVLVEVNGISTLRLSHSQVLETLRRVTGEDLLMTLERKSKPLDKKSGSDVTAVESTEVKEDKQSQTTKEGVSASVQSADEIRFEETREARGGAAGVTPPPETQFAAASGPRPLQPQSQRYSSGPQRTPFEFQTVQSRPFVEPASRHGRRPNAPSSTQPPRHVYQPQQQRQQQQPQLQQQSSSSRDLQEDESLSPEYYSSGESAHYQRQEEVPQSRTFRQLQSVMSNEEQGAGVDGLPPPKSASLERMKSDGGSAGNSSPRVKVLMAQKYNSPLGMYSANNAIETFAAQAESAIESLEKQQQQSIGTEYHPVFSSPRQQ